MNKRLARKRAMWRGLKFPEPILKRGLYENTGSLGMAYGLWKPRLYVDPRLLGEHRVLREFITNHEGAHLALGHTRLLTIGKWMGALFVAALLGTIVAITTGAPWLAFTALAVGAWTEAKLSLFTLPLRAMCEREADQVAASMMIGHHYATAIKTIWSVEEPRSAYARWERGVIYGQTWVDRLNRSGLSAVDA